VPVEKIESMVQLEPALVIIGLALGAWLGYKLLLRGISEERHRNLRRLFQNLSFHLLMMCGLFLSYYLITHFAPEEDAYERVGTYVGLFTLIFGATAFVKTARILLFEYLFLSHMRVAVPLLLVNIFSLLLSITTTGWVITEIFNIRLAPLLATSAIFSLVLGLALQDTLGNLFAGVAIQFDKPYELGDWVEVHNGGQKWVGQVNEVSWRATVLIGLGDEAITIPNRIMGQAQISNFSLKTRPIIRSQSFRLSYGTDLAKARQHLERAALGVPEVRKNPAPLVILSEAGESWITAKLVYFIDNYGSQFLIGDRVITAALRELDDAGIALATPRLTVAQTVPENAV